MADEDITQLLRKWAAGDREAAERVLPLVYDELRRMAARQLRRERKADTLQPTAIVHDAYVHLVSQPGLEWLSRAHFFAFSARLIRRLLVDHARHRNRAKRGGLAEKVTLVDAPDPALGRSLEWIALDEALSCLETMDPRKARIVELKFFAGLTLDEIAGQLGISAETVSREWRRTRAWLLSALRTDTADGA